MRRRGEAIDGRSVERPASHRDHQADAPAQCVDRAPAIDAALEAMRRVGREVERAARPPHPRGIEPGAFEEDVGGRRR